MILRIESASAVFVIFIRRKTRSASHPTELMRSLIITISLYVPLSLLRTCAIGLKFSGLARCHRTSLRAVNKGTHWFFGGGSLRGDDSVEAADLIQRGLITLSGLTASGLKVFQGGAYIIRRSSTDGSGFIIVHAPRQEKISAGP